MEQVVRNTEVLFGDNFESTAQDVLNWLRKHPKFREFWDNDQPKWLTDIEDSVVAMAEPWGVRPVAMNLRNEGAYNVTIRTEFIIYMAYEIPDQKAFERNSADELMDRTINNPDWMKKTCDTIVANHNYILISDMLGVEVVEVHVCKHDEGVVS